jgi:hypothetical protein
MIKKTHEVKKYGRAAYTTSIALLEVRVMSDMVNPKMMAINMTARISPATVTTRHCFLLFPLLIEGPKVILYSCVFHPRASRIRFQYPRSITSKQPAKNKTMIPNAGAV